jgi:hypothetical protein
MPLTSAVPPAIPGDYAATAAGDVAGEAEGRRQHEVATIRAAAGVRGTATEHTARGWRGGLQRDS